MSIQPQNNPTQTLLTLVNHIASQHLQLAKHIEDIVKKIQGKGYGTATIQQENDLVHMLLGRKPTIAIDIGGTVGEYTAELRRRNPNLEIHTFEPSHTNIQKLNSDNAGSGLGGLTKRKLEHFNIAFNVTETIETICFEDYWKSNLNERAIDIVKIDIEGHELTALGGFGRAIDEVSVIQFEFGGCNIDTRTYFQDFWYFFKEHGFNIFRITPFGAEHIQYYSEADEYFSTTNYIAVKKSKPTQSLL